MTVTAESNITALELGLIDSLFVEAKAAIDASGLAVDGRALKVYDHEPADADTLPAVYIEGPGSVRAVHDQQDKNSMLGSFDWEVVLNVLIRVRMDTPSEGQKNLRGLIGAVYASINRVNPTLDATSLLGAFFTDGETDLDSQVAQTRVANFTAQLTCWALTPTE